MAAATAACASGGSSVCKARGAAKTRRAANGNNRRGGLVRTPRRTPGASRTHAVATEPRPAIDLANAVVLEIVTSVTRPLPSGKDTANGGDGGRAWDVETAMAFVSSKRAMHAALAGGPEPATRVSSNLEGQGGEDDDGGEMWRVKAPGFSGRLFFVGPFVALNPVNVFLLSTSSTSSPKSNDTNETISRAAATLTLTQQSGQMEGTPASVVTWVNKAYRAEKTVTSVTVDLTNQTITTALDLKIVLEIPKVFRFVDKHKIQKGMRDAFEPQTNDAMREVCDGVALAFEEWEKETQKLGIA